jgi:hypothetical protein
MYFARAKAQGEKSGQKFLDKAKECLGVAKALHRASDQQHRIADSKNDTADAQHYNASKLDANANKLEAVSGALIADAIEVRDEFAIDERLQFRERPEIALPASPVIPKAVPK